MTGRQRQMAAIRHEITDRIPVDWIGQENAEAVAAAAGQPGGDVELLLGRDGRISEASKYTGPVARHPQGKAVTIWGAEDGNDYGIAHYYPLAAAETVARSSAGDFSRAAAGRSMSCTWPTTSPPSGGC